MRIFKVATDQGDAVALGGLGVIFKLLGEQTGGAFAVLEHPLDAGKLVLPHVHQHEDEYSYVLEGSVGFRVGDQELIARPGTYLIKPRGLMHTFWNSGPEKARLLEIVAPPGFETYFRQLAEAADPDQRDELASKFGVTYSSEWVPELMKRFSLTLVGH